MGGRLRAAVGARPPPARRFRSLLVPVDGTPFGEHALPLALGLARRAGASVRLVYVHSPLESTFDTGRLYHNSALDAWLTPIQMKKGRPGMTLSALCPVTAADRLGAVLLRETSSLGYRKLPATRGERPRRFIEVPTPYGLIPVKVGSGPWGSPQIKPEFDVCAARAREHGVAVRDVVQVALVMARQELGEL